MDKKIAVAICNYNGGEFVIRCVRSVMNSDRDDYDIVIVDNASQDGSSDRLKQEFGEDILILHNNDNLGGAGGFDRGFRYAIDKGYSYVMAMDNDAYIAEDTISLLYDYLEDNIEVGMAAAKIISDDDKDKLIDYEGELDFAHGDIIMPWNGREDCEQTCLVREREFATTTASLIRLEALVESGGMDPDYFIYLDDIEMTYRMRVAGYKLVSVGKARAWNKSRLSQSGISSTFKTYYLERNRLYFFAKYSRKNERETFVNNMLSDIYHKICIADFEKATEIKETYIFALEDFINGIRGKAKDGRVRKCNTNKLDSTIIMDEEYEAGKKVFFDKYSKKMLQTVETLAANVSSDNCTELLKEIKKGLFRWYTFTDNSRVLIVDDDKEGEVLTDDQAKCIKTEVYSSQEIINGNVNLNNLYDYVLCEKLPDDMSDAICLLLKISGLLEDEGILLFGARNSMAIKYFCGEHYPYNSEHAICTLSDWKKILKELGLVHVRAWGVYPDFEHPFYMCSEDYKPNEEVRCRIFPFYNTPHLIYRDEMSMYQQLVDNGMFVDMANSFFIECTRSGILSDAYQVTGSFDRGERDAFATLIMRNGTVEKVPIYPKGIMKNYLLCRNANELKKQGIESVCGEIIGKHYVLPYVEGPTGHLYLLELLKTDKEKFLKKFDEFISVVRKSSGIYVGSYQYLFEETELFETAYMDMVPLNSIYIDGSFVFFDQEFTHKAYPVKAVIYRAIHSLYSCKPELDHFYPVMDLYNKYGLAEELWKWDMLESRFLSELKNGSLLSSYWDSHSTNPDTIRQNQHRMNYTEDDFRRHFVDILDDLEGRKLYLFGSGKYAHSFIETYGCHYEIAGCIDNNADKCGDSILGIRIYKPDELAEQDTGTFKVIICVKNYHEIVNQLLMMGINNYGIYNPQKAYRRFDRIIKTGKEIKNDKKYHIGYVSGVFDLFHQGHLNLLRNAKAKCDYLIVGIVSDEGVRKHKKIEPFVPYEEREDIVRSCKYVDEVVKIPLDLNGPKEAWEMYHYDVQFLGSDYLDDPYWMDAKKYLNERGADLVFFSYTESTNSTKVKKLIEEKLI